MAAATRLVGAVGIKVRPVAAGFRREADRQIKKEMSGASAEVELKPTLEAGAAQKITRETKAVKDKAEAETGPIEIDVNLRDRNSLEAAIQRIKRELQALGDEKVPLEVDEDGLRRQLGEMRKALKDSTVEIGFNTDEQGLKDVIARAKAMKREVEQDHIEVQFGDDLDSKIAEWEAKLKALEGKKQTVKTVITYDRDRASLEAAIAKTEARLREMRAVKVPINWDDKADVEKWYKELQKRLANYPLKLKVRNDQDSWNKVISDLQARRADLEKKTVFVMSPDEAKTVRGVDKALARARAQAAAAPVHVDITYRENTDSLDKAIADIKAHLAAMKGAQYTIDADLDEAGLRAKLAELEHKRTTIPVTVEYDNNAAGLAALKARIEAELARHHTMHIELALDEAGLRAQLAMVRAQLLTLEHSNRIRLPLSLNAGDYAKVWTAIKLLTKNQTVNIFTKLNNASLLLAAAKLTGLRAASRWSEELAQSLGTLDRNLPIVAGATMLFSQLSAGITTLVADAFSLGNGLGQVVRGIGLLSPAILTGLGASFMVFKGVFKDFGAALNGDDKALKKLSASGKEAVAALRPAMMQLREAISKNFWDQASDSIKTFSNQTMPVLTKATGALAASLGNLFGSLLDSVTKMAKSGGLEVFFGNLTRGWDLARPGFEHFFDAFLKLSTVGSTMFPRMGRAWDEMAGKFSSWVDRVSADGTLQRWIDQGVQGLKDLFNAAGSLVKIWGNIGHAAEAAGALTLHSFADMLSGLDRATSGARFQRNLTTIFEGAVQASETFHKALAGLGPSMDQFSVTVAHTFTGASKAISALAADLGDIMASPKLDQGITAFLTGLVSMFESLRPAMGAVVTIISTFEQILGQVATDAGPLFRNLFIQLANVLTAAWNALQPFLPGLMEIGTEIINTLGPNMANLAGSVIPAFANALEHIGSALIPLITIVAKVASGFADFASGIPLPILAGIATSILSLNVAMQAAAVVTPLATAAFNLFRGEVVLTAAATQLAVPVVGILLAALTGLVGFGITALASGQQNATPYANEYADALQRDADAAGNATNKIGEYTTKLALQKFVQSGAYDSANKLGISNQQLTDALLKGGSAWDFIQSKIKDARGAYDGANASALLAAQANNGLGDSTQGVSDDIIAQRDAANSLDKVLNENKGSLEAGMRQNQQYADAAKAAGIHLNTETKATQGLSTAAQNTSSALQAAAGASQALTDAFSAPSAKIDAMRKSFDLLLGPNAKQQVAEATGAYVKGFNDLKDSASSVAPQIKQLGKDAYGPDGFLNVAKGNAAVLQVNQALKSEVDNVWAGAKAAYDAAVQQGKSAQDAMAAAQGFINSHKQDYNDLATASGLAAKDVQGQWDAVFGHPWVLEVSLRGATEATTVVQQMVATLHGTFDGKEWIAYLNANPDQALLAIQDPVKAATNFINTKWEATLTAQPKPALDALTGIMQRVMADWTTNTDFQATLRVAQGIPGLAEALQDIRNGVGQPFYAQIFASINPASLASVEVALLSLTQPRTVAISVAYTDSGQTYNQRPGGLMVPQGNDGGLWGASGFPLNVGRFANGGYVPENHVAQIARGRAGMVRVWAEQETGAEAYIPYALTKRARSTQILSRVASDFGYDLVRKYNNGGMSQSSSTSYHAPVHIGTLIATDMDEAVSALQMKRRDSQAAHMIKPF